MGTVVYSRADLLRILHLTARQLANWERAGLIVASPAYSFADLLKVKKVRDLCALRVRPAVIRQSLEAMQKQASGMGNPLVDAGVSFTSKHRVAFRHEGRLLEPIAGQFVMDFTAREKVVTSTPIPTPEPGMEENEAAVWFARGIALALQPGNGASTGAQDKPFVGSHGDGPAFRWAFAPLRSLCKKPRIGARTANPARKVVFIPSLLI